MPINGARTVVIKGTLEVQTYRGVVYFHDEQGRCVLRLVGVQTPIPDPTEYQIEGKGKR